MAARLEVTITYLRQEGRPAFTPQPRPQGKIAIMRAEAAPLHFYRYLYDVVGRKWNWVSRRKLDDEALLAIIHDPATYLYVLYVNGVPAGLAEIYLDKARRAELRFFGLTADYIGRGLARYFLANVIDLAWALDPECLLLETCTLDHPAALPLYQKFGFTVFDQKKGSVERLEDLPPLKI
ncbi:MAG: GNAT family N-acetyltransferase [Parvularculaceae bacterium]